MKLSSLQKYILKNALQYNKSKISRNIFDKFYDNSKNPPPQKIRANIITKSIERLIDKGLIVGFGEKTQHRLFITQIQLTNKGQKTACELLGQQTKLPLKLRKKIKKRA